jgi:phage FluMu protein Com
MNKYQKALGNVRDDIADIREITNTYTTKKNLDALQELVNIAPKYRKLKAKDTPKQIIFKLGVPQCPRCKSFNTIYNSFSGHYKRCAACGQALAWGGKVNGQENKKSIDFNSRTHI